MLNREMQMKLNKEKEMIMNKNALIDRNNKIIEELKIKK